MHARISPHRTLPSSLEGFIADEELGYVLQRYREVCAGGSCSNIMRDIKPRRASGARLLARAQRI